MDEYLYKKKSMWGWGDGYIKFRMFDCFYPTPDQFSHFIGPFYKDSVSGFVVEILVMNFGDEGKGRSELFIHLESLIYILLHPHHLIHHPVHQLLTFL